MPGSVFVPVLTPCGLRESSFQVTRGNLPKLNSEIISQETRRKESKCSHFGDSSDGRSDPDICRDFIPGHNHTARVPSQPAVVCQRKHASGACQRKHTKTSAIGAIPGRRDVLFVPGNTFQMSKHQRQILVCDYSSPQVVHGVSSSFLGPVVP